MTDTSQMLALFILSFGLGGVVIVALVIEQLWQRIALTLLLSYAGASLFSSGDASHVFISVPGGNLTSFAVIALSALAIARLLFFKLKDLRNFCRQYLMPQLWKPPATEPLSFDDFGKRWFVTVAAATGNVVGLLMSDPGAFHTFLDAFAPQRIFFTLLATVISIALIGPGEEFIFGAGFRSSSTYGQTHGHLEDIRKNLSWRAVGRFALVLAPWLAINVMHKCMDESINSGQIKTSLEILIASVGPGMVTFYWCAALQRGVPAVADAVFNGVVVASTFLFLPLTIFIVMHTLEQVYVVFGSRIVSDIGLVATVAIAVIAAMVLPFLVYITAIICGFVLYGLLSGFGGLVLDAERQAKRGPFQTIVRLILTAGAYQAVLFIALLALLDRFFGVSIEMSSLSNLSFLVATLGWGFGLLVSGFPTIVENARSPSP
jgi:hypothetical protein